MRVRVAPRRRIEGDMPADWGARVYTRRRITFRMEVREAILNDGYLLIPDGFASFCLSNRFIDMSAHRVSYVG